MPAHEEKLLLLKKTWIPALNASVQSPSALKRVDKEVFCNIKPANSQLSFLLWHFCRDVKMGTAQNTLPSRSYLMGCLQPSERSPLCWMWMNALNILNKTCTIRLILNHVWALKGGSHRKASLVVMERAAVLRLLNYWANGKSYCIVS